MEKGCCLWGAEMRDNEGKMEFNNEGSWHTSFSLVLGFGWLIFNQHFSSSKANGGATWGWVWLSS